MSGNNPPFKVVEFTQEQYEFLMENCESNLILGLKLLQNIQFRDNAIKLVDMMEKFKSIKKALEAGT